MKSGSLKISLIVFITFLCFYTKAQNDIINTVKGDKIICTITKEDSAKVYFKVGGNVGGVEASLDRSQITSIQYAPKKAPEIPVLMVNPAQAQSDDYVAPTSSINAAPTITTSSKPAHPNLVYFGFGLSAPVGKFNNEILDTNEIGPGMNGAMATIGLTHFLNKNFGFNVNALYSNNELNTKPITSKYKNNTDSIWTANTVYWRSFGISFGLVYMKEFNDFSFFAKASGGYLSLKYPDLKLTNHSNNYLQVESVTADAFSFGGGIGGGYKLNENLNLSLEINYIQANFKYNEILILGETPGTTFNNKVSITKRDVKQSYQCVLITLGLGYLF